MIDKPGLQMPGPIQHPTERPILDIPDLPVQPETLTEARLDVQSCRNCPLYRNATQAVFGEGPDNAPVMFVGEQPGDQEDLAGRPFVGPAGKMFDAVLAEIGFERAQAYVTNAVKHFKFLPRGKKRIHQKPDRGEIEACRFWLERERDFVHPRIIVALGATAVQGLLGKSATITSLRGAPSQLADGTWLFVTVHPSYLLRIPDREQAARERARFTAELAEVKRFAENLPGAADRSGLRETRSLS